MGCCDAPNSSSFSPLLELAADAIGMETALSNTSKALQNSLILSLNVALLELDRLLSCPSTTSNPKRLGDDG
eukprot:scaffold16874_cov123-Skeletonema_dohrnii-CCMP3373.AAC.3